MVYVSRALTLQVVVAMDRLLQELYMLYSKELLNLNIGYSINKKVLDRMMDLICTIQYLKHTDVSRKDFINIISHYNEV